MHFHCFSAEMYLSSVCVAETVAGCFCLLLTTIIKLVANSLLRSLLTFVCLFLLAFFPLYSYINT